MDFRQRHPQGDHSIFWIKCPPNIWADGNLFADADDYELPGVPWTCFFTAQGHAFHGTYWHENFGVPMSHGCINMRTEEAKWLFRWALPKHQIRQVRQPRLLARWFKFITKHA